VKDPAGTLVMQLHFQGPTDRTPMQMVSRARLDYLERMEAEALYLRKVVLAVRLAIVSNNSAEK
jgi:hypothetical protein